LDASSVASASRNAASREVAIRSISEIVPDRPIAPSGRGRSDQRASGVLDLAVYVND